jgi:hypothetical protein
MRYACQHARVVEASLTRVRGSLHLIRFLWLTAAERSLAYAGALSAVDRPVLLIALRFGESPGVADHWT